MLRVPPSAPTPYFSAIESYHREATQPELFPIADVPAVVRAHGLRDAHSRPLVAGGKGRCGFRARRVSTSDAWLYYASIELRAGNSWPAMVFDCDGRDAGRARPPDSKQPGGASIMTRWRMLDRRNGGSANRREGKSMAEDDLAELAAEVQRLERDNRRLQRELAR